MRFQQKLKLKTFETKPFFEIKIGKYSLFETALFKIGKLDKLTRNDNKKAKQELDIIDKYLKHSTNILKEQIQNSKQAIKLKLGYLPDFVNKITIEKDFDFSNPLQCQLIQLIIVLDECFYWLHCSKQYELFDEDGFFIRRKTLKNNNLQFISKVAGMLLKKEFA